MAKSKSFFTLRSGSTKSLTLSTLHGAQITKDRVRNNSTTDSGDAIEARARLTLVSQCRARLRRILDHSFEGVPYGYKSLEEFSRVNLAKNALDVIQWAPKSSDNIGSAAFKISNGTLPELTLNKDPYFSAWQYGNNFVMDAQFNPCIAFGKVPQNRYLVIPEEDYTKYDGSISDLINKNNLAMAFLCYLLNISQDEQLTVLFQMHSGNAIKEIAGRSLTYPLTTYKYARLSPSLPNDILLITNLTSGDEGNNYIRFLHQHSGILLGVKVVLSLATNAAGKYALIHPSTSDPVYTIGSFTGGFNGELPQALMYGLIASRKDGDGIWRRSPCKLRKFYYYADVVSKSDTLASYYKRNGGQTGANQFLNNGSDSTGISGNSGHTIQSNLQLADNLNKDDSGSDNGNK